MAQVQVPDRYELAKQEFFNQPEGFPFDNFDLADVNLPPNDDLGIKSDDDDEEDDTIDAETGFGSAVVLDGLPVIGAEKYEKLKTVLTRICSTHGNVREGCFWMPQQEDGSTKGFAFVEYSRREEAMQAVAQLNKHRLDKNHVLVANLLDDVDRLAQIPETYEAPELKPFDAQTDIYSWLLDKRGRDQFLIQYKNENEVCWNDSKKGEAEVSFSRSFWTEGPLTWSPHGTYLATLHRQGVVLWASRADGDFIKVTRFACPDVQMLTFSAHEEYITLFSVQPQGPREPPMVTMSVCDCRSGMKLRVLRESLDTLLVGSMNVNANRMRVPFLSWSPAKPALCAKMMHDAVQVYNGADMTMLDKQSVKLEGIVDIKWSPTDNILATYQQEVGNMPARVSLVSFPDKTELRQKNLFMVSNAAIYWHPQGKYLAVQVAKLTKTKKTTYTSVELFKVHEKGTPNDVLELVNKTDKVLTIAWEPHGDRFAIVHGDPLASRFSISFYTMLDKSLKEGAKLIGTVENRQVSDVYWSPAGKNIVFAGLESNTGQLEFFNVDDMNSHRSQQHFMCTTVAWDHTGRHVCTYVDSTRDMEHGYIIWSFTGDMLYRSRLDNFLNFAWRPRPPSQLPEEKAKEVAKNLRQYTKKFEEQDVLLLEAADADTLERRRELRDEWNAYMAAKEEYLKEQEAFMKSIYGSVMDPKPFSTQMQENEQIIDIREEPYVG